MASEIELILRWFYYQYFIDGILDFDDLLLRGVKDTLAVSAMDAEAYVYRNTKRLWNELLKKLEADRRLGRSPLFSVLDKDARRLQWLPCSIGLANSTKERQFAIRLRARPYMMQMIGQLSDREYEALGCVVSSLAGASDVNLTPRSNEGGIDFFAVINTPAKCHVFHGDYRPLRIVGQSKKHGEKIKVNQVKEFVETLDEVKNQSPSIERLVPPWFRTSCGPIIGWLITHHGAQSGALTKAQNHGIIISDSVDLAEIAALSRKIDCTLSAVQRAVRIRTSVLEMLCTEKDLAPTASP